MKTNFECLNYLDVFTMVNCDDIYVKAICPNAYTTPGESSASVNMRTCGITNLSGKQEVFFNYNLKALLEKAL